MASITREPNGRRTIQFMAADGKRKSIRLGKVSQGTAEKVKVKVECLAAAASSACPLDHETAAWVSKIGEDLAGKLAAAGLIARRATAGRLGEFLDTYIARRTDHKPNTAKTIAQARRLLVEYFGEDKPLDQIKAADAENWRNELRAKGYKPATIATHIKRAKQMWRACRRRRDSAAQPLRQAEGAAASGQIAGSLRRPGNHRGGTFQTCPTRCHRGCTRCRMGV